MASSPPNEASGEARIPASGFLAHALPRPTRDRRPNILLLTTDQQRHDTLGAGGHDFMQTPNLDRLAGEGTRYTQAYTPVPICLAARHSLLTGLPPRAHGFPDNMHQAVTRADLPTLPRLLSDAGYESRAIGKMHFIPARRHNGFDRMELMEELPWYREQDDYALYLQSVGLGHIQHIHGVRHLLYMLPQQSLIPEAHHGTKWVADRGMEFLRTNRGRQPFFLWLSWIAPHPPFDVPARWADAYADAEVPAPVVAQTPTSALAEENRLLGDLPGPAYVRRMREAYFASISFVDEQIGRVLEMLETTGLADNTLVLFTSDHGELLGDYGLYQKWLPYDACTRVPFIMRFPGRVEGGAVRDEFIDLMDILPTALDAAEVAHPQPEALPGASLLTTEPARARTAQFTEYSFDNRRWISLRTADYKYNYYYGGGAEELFDLRRDPEETTNLLAQGVPEKWATVRAALRRRLTEHEQQWGLPGYVADGELLSGPPYVPHPQRNEAFPRFPSQIMEPAARAGMNDLFDEVLAAVAEEPIVRLRELDVAAWQANGDFSDEEIATLLARDDARHAAPAPTREESA